MHLCTNSREPVSVPFYTSSTREPGLNTALSFDNMFQHPSGVSFAAQDIYCEDQDPFIDPRCTTQSLQSSSSSSQSYGSHESQFRVLNGNPWQASWMSSPGNCVPSHHTQNAQENFTDILQPSPQRAYHKLTQQHNSKFAIETDHAHAPGIGLAIPYQKSNWPGKSTSLESGIYSQSSAFGNALASYPPLPPPVPDDLHESPFSTPHRRRAKSSSRSPSPPVSPTNMRSRSLKQKSPTRPDQSHHRRKSIHKLGPIKDSSNDVQRNRSASRPPRTPKTPKQPNGGFGSIDFVNYTPKDAVKLLTDVAPSGSSRTRARREQEAKDKRKKLSEAALQAVRIAGGDVTALEQAMLQGNDDEDEF